MREIKSQIRLTPFQKEFITVTGTHIDVVFNPGVGKYDENFYNLNKPVIIFAAEDADGEITVEARYSINGSESFFFPTGEFVSFFLGYDEGLFGAVSNPVNIGSTTVFYSYKQAVFVGNDKFTVLGKETNATYIINVEVDGVSANKVRVGDLWTLGNIQTIGGYVP